MNYDRAASLLASGLKPAQVASVLGVTPARISQLLSEDSFKLLLSSKEAEVQKLDIEEQAISTKYNAAEHTLIDQVMTLVPTAEMRDIVGALRVVAERQERMKTRTIMQLPSQPSQQLTVVAINLPAHALASPKVIMNSTREVVAIGDRPLAPMTADAVASMFQSTPEGGHNEYLSSNQSAEAGSAKALPSPATQEDGFLSYMGVKVGVSHAGK